MNERSDGKTDITFELRTVENLRRSIKGKMACSHVRTIYVTVHIDGSMT